MDNAAQALSHNDQLMEFSFSQNEIPIQKSVGVRSSLKTTAPTIKPTELTSKHIALQFQESVQVTKNIGSTVEATSSNIQDQHKLVPVKIMGTRSNITLHSKTTKNQLLEYPVEHLKDCLKSRKLSQVGKKTILVDRLYKNLIPTD